MIIGGDITSALTSFAGLGLALILEGDGAKRVRLGWTDEAAPRLEVNAEGYDDAAIAAAVHRHAAHMAEKGCWIHDRLTNKFWLNKQGKPIAATMGARIATPSVDEREKWEELQRSRFMIIDSLQRCALRGELELAGSLGELSYWCSTTHAGATRWDMEVPRSGRGILLSKLSPISEFVEGLSDDHIAEGLSGLVIHRRQVGGGAVPRDSAGLTPPGEVDSTLVWCALWGISSFPLFPRVGAVSVPAARIPNSDNEVAGLILPVLVGGHSLARWRALLVSWNLVAALSDRQFGCREWLKLHGVRALLKFDIHEKKIKPPSPNEYYLLAGRIEVLA